MAEFPSMPVWTDAYLADCGHLSDAEHGRYFMILMAMWRAQDCRLPNDDEWLAKKFRRSSEEVREQLRPLISEFCQCTKNWITQKRLAREMEFLRASREKQSKRAKSRWEKEKDECRGNATPHHSGNASSGNALSTPTPTPTISPNGDPPIDPPPETEITPLSVDKTRRGTRISPDWQPNDQDVTFAAERGIDPAPARDEFVDYWISQTGRNAVKADWSATWRNHIRRMAERRIGRNGGSRNGPGTGPLVIDQHGNVDQRGAENPRSRPGRAGPSSVAAALDQISAARKTGGSGW